MTAKTNMTIVGRRCRVKRGYTDNSSRTRKNVCMEDLSLERAQATVPVRYEKE